LVHLGAMSASAPDELDQFLRAATLNKPFDQAIA
jgi:hypothetical protein